MNRSRRTFVAYATKDCTGGDASSWRAPFRFCACIGTMNQIGTPLPALSPQGGERVAAGRERGSSWRASIRFRARIGTLNPPPPPNPSGGRESMSGHACRVPLLGGARGARGGLVHGRRTQSTDGRAAGENHARFRPAQAVKDPLSYESYITSEVSE